MDKEQLLELYRCALFDAQSFFLSDYCASSEEANERKKEDEENLKQFIKILNKI